MSFSTGKTAFDFGLKILKKILCVSVWLFADSS